MKGSRVRFRLIALLTVILLVIGLFSYMPLFGSLSIYLDSRSSHYILQSNNIWTYYVIPSDLCSPRATHRGFNQRVIAVSLFGPKENSLFQRNRSLSFLRDLIGEAQQVYPSWILRIYHDDTADGQIVHAIERQHDHVDFCNMTGRSFMPPRMWRYLPVGDLFVDVMISRDLDSPLTQRERSAVDDWLESKKIFHAMRDHPRHNTPLLAGMWGFRPALNRTLSLYILKKLQNETLLKAYVGVGDQPFLVKEVWPHVENSSIVHDSFHCQSFGGHGKPFPTQRPFINGSNIFVGCIKPCSHDHYVFGECPVACRPSNHKEWIYC